MKALELQGNPLASQAFGEMPPEVVPMATRIFGSEAGRRALTYLRRHPRLALTASDLAHTVNQPVDEIAHALTELVDLGVVREQAITGLVFYRLAADSEQLSLLERFFAWYETCVRQVRDLQAYLGVGT